MERLRDIYDNDFMEEMLFTRDQQHENSATIHQNEDEIQPEVMTIKEREKLVHKAVTYFILIKHMWKQNIFYVDHTASC